MFMKCLLNDVFLCSLMGYLQCWVVFTRKFGFQTGFHNKIQLVSNLVIIYLKTISVVLTWVKSIPFL